MDIIWLLVRASWTSVVIAVLSGLVSGGCSAFLIALINQAMTQSAPQSLITPFAGMALLALLASGLSQFLLIDLAQDTVYRLRMQLSDRILAAPLQQLETLGPSKLIAILTKDVQTISNTMFIIPFLCTEIAVIIGCLAYMGWLSGWMFLIVAVFLIMAIALVQIFITASYRYIALARTEVNKLFECFKGVTEGTKELKLHSTRRQLFMNEELGVSALTSRKYEKTAYKLAAMSATSGKFLFFLLIGLLLFGVPQLIPSAQAVLPAYILTITYMIGSIESVISRVPELANANVSIKTIENTGLALTQNAEIDSVAHKNTVSEWKTLALKEIVHTYYSGESDRPFTLGPIDLTIEAGELVFIVGGNGSGKSTLAKLLTGLYIPESGEIRLDNEPIVDTNREWYRQHFSAIFSDFYLFNRLVSTEALTLDSQAKIYLEKLQLDQKVSVKGGQLSTTALSQGQRKRLALLAAYLEDRSLYLFDEWAADQDPIFREIFYTQILAELKQRGKTVIVISHDDRYFHLADRMIKLDYGRIESNEIY